MSIKVGDVVRVRDPSIYQAALAKRIRDRDAIVLRVGGEGLFKSSARVRFTKRNGRGKEFEERIRICDLVRVDGGSVE